MRISAKFVAVSFVVEETPSPAILTATPVNRIEETTRDGLIEGRIMPVKKDHTIADGLRTSLGDNTFPIIKKHVREIFTATESQIVDTMRLIWERMKILVEPSAAVPLAALLANPDQFAGKRVGIVLSGGNVDLDALPWVTN